MTRARKTTDIVDQAIAWLLQIEADPAVSQGPALAQWLAADARHAQAWDRLRSIDSRYTTLDAHAGRALRLSQPKPRAARKTMTQAVLGVFVIACTAVVAHRFVPLTGLTAQYATSTGIGRSVRLADGTLVHMDTRTAFDVVIDGTTRTLVLRSGAVAIETGHGDALSFAVQTPQTRVRPLGTYFTVRRDTQSSDVTVIRSAVAVAVNDGAGLATATSRTRRADEVNGANATNGAVGFVPVLGPTERIVKAGEQLRVDAAGHVIAASTAAKYSDAWTQGMLVVDRMPLGEFIQQLARYRSDVLSVDPSIADVPISGSFSLADTDLALAAMAQAARVRIARPLPGWVRLMPGSMPLSMSSSMPGSATPSRPSLIPEK